MLLSPKYGKQSRLPSNNRAATLRDKPSWCPTRCCWCKIDLRTGCSVWHQPSQDGMQGDPDLIGLVYVLHVHGTWNIFIYIYIDRRSSEPAKQSFAIPTSLIRFVSTTSGPRINFRPDPTKTTMKGSRNRSLVEICSRVSMWLKILYMFVQSCAYLCHFFCWK